MAELKRFSLFSTHNQIAALLSLFLLFALFLVENQLMEKNLLVFSFG